MNLKVMNTRLPEMRQQNNFILIGEHYVRSMVKVLNIMDFPQNTGYQRIQKIVHSEHLRYWRDTL